MPTAARNSQDRTGRESLSDVLCSAAALAKLSTRAMPTKTEEMRIKRKQWRRRMLVFCELRIMIDPSSRLPRGAHTTAVLLKVVANSSMSPTWAGTGLCLSHAAGLSNL